MEEQFIDLYNINKVDGNDVSSEQIDNLVKAVSATQQTGRDLTDTSTAGASLKLESLDPTVKILTNTDKHIQFWKKIPKDKAYDTVHQFSQLLDHGLNTTSIFNGEGETPQFTDPEYVKRAKTVKYMGISGEVTDVANIVRTQVGNMLSEAVRRSTSFLLRALNEQLPTANSSLVGYQFDGYFKQHYDGITEGSLTPLDTYANDGSVIDARGQALKDEYVSEATRSITSDGYGFADTIVGNASVFNNYIQRFADTKRVLVNNPVSATTGATMGQAVQTIATQNGTVEIMQDIFFDRKRVISYNQAATGSKSPATPTIGSAIAVATDTNTKFTDGAGSYFYLVTSKNRYGESAPLVINTSGQAVTATQAVDLSFTITDNAYAAESFVIYRTEADESDRTTAKYYPVMEVTLAERTAGYDGGAAGLVRDRNRVLPNTSDALVLSFDKEVLSYFQLAPFRRMDLAFTSPAYRYMILAYGTPALLAPKKIARIRNLGEALS